MKDLYKVRDVARYLGVCDVTVIRLIKSGKLRGFKVGRHYGIYPEALKEFEKTRLSYVGYHPLPEQGELPDKASLE